MSQTLKIKRLTADFDYIFESTLTGFIVKEQDIREEFERNADDGKTLQEKLDAIGMTLEEFMRHSFGDRYRYIHDESAPSYIMLSVLRGNQPALTAPTPTTASPTCPPASVASCSSNEQGTSSNKVEMRKTHLMKQFENSGLTGVFHPDALVEHYGDLSDLVSDSELDDEADDNGESSKYANSNAQPPQSVSSEQNASHETVQCASPFEITTLRALRLSKANDATSNDGEAPVAAKPTSSAHNPSRAAPPVLAEFGQTPPADLVRPQPLTAVASGQSNTAGAAPLASATALPPPGFGPLRPPSSKTAALARAQAQQLPSSSPHAQPIVTTMSSSDENDNPQLAHARTPPYEIVEDDDPSPSGSASLRSSVPSTPSPPPSPPVQRHETILEDLVQQQRREVAAPKPAAETAKRSSGLTYALPHVANDFQVRASELFYKVEHDSIQNSTDVNRYRNAFRADVQARNPSLWSEAPRELRALGASNENLSVVIATLQQIASMYPSGMSIDELVALEECLEQRQQSNYFGNVNRLLSLDECVDEQLIVRKSDDRYHVADFIRNIQLWQLPPGLTSNVFRLLSAEGKATITEVAQHVGVHVDSKTHAAMHVTEEDIVRQANCWPLVFEVNAQAAQQASLRSATISLDKQLPKWKVLLDCKAKSDVVMMCDCNDCTNGHAPVVVKVV